MDTEQAQAQAQAYFEIHTLLQLENLQKCVLPEAERLFSESRGELNVQAAKKRRQMMTIIISNLYASCAKAGLQHEADRIVHGATSPMLEEYRKQHYIEGLMSR